MQSDKPSKPDRFFLSKVELRASGLPEAEWRVLYLSFEAIQALSPEDYDAQGLCLLLCADFEGRNIPSRIPRRYWTLALAARIQPDESLAAWFGRLPKAELVIKFVWKIVFLHILHYQQPVGRVTPDMASIGLAIIEGSK